MSKQEIINTAKMEIPQRPLESPEINTNCLDKDNSMEKIVYKHTWDGNKVETSHYSSLYPVKLWGFLSSKLPKQD